MLTSMYKWEQGKTLYVYGDLNKQDIAELRQEGWKVEHRDKPAGKHGIPQEGERGWQHADDAGGRSRHRRASKPGTGRPVGASRKRPKRSS